ncbi:MAG: ferredoxin reductase family protein [Actinomycetes bacterium]
MTMTDRSTLENTLVADRAELDTRAVPSLPGRAMAQPTSSRLSDTDIAGVLAAYSLCVVGMWSVHGGMTKLSQGWGPAWASVTSLTGLLTSAVALVALVLVGRPLSLERRFGLDRMFIWHRMLGDSMGILLGLHVVAGTIAWASDSGWINAVIDLTGRTPYMALAFVSALLIGIVTVSSLKSIRQKLAYETWYFVHLLAYLAMAISFGHQIYLGTDLAGDTVARWFWVSLHVAVVALMLVARWGRTLKAFVRPLRVMSIESVGHKTVAIQLSGVALAHRQGDAGQFCFIRPLTQGLWWQSHPYSMSAAPTTDRMRFTIKDRGEASHLMTGLKVGTRVIVEGPFGIVTPDVLQGSKVLFVVGGVGVAPVLAMAQRLGPDHEPIVLYRAHSEKDLLHFAELKAAVERLGGRVLTLTGPTAKLAVRDPFSAKVLTAAIPDIAKRAVVMCGPDRLLHAARSGLKAAGVPASRIHSEHVWW